MPIRFLTPAWLLALLLLAACTSDGSRHHDAPMPDPAEYNAHFGDLDADGNDRVTPSEFNAYFPKGDAKVFDLIDADRDGTISHDEWHRFKEAHGMVHH